MDLPSNDREEEGCVVAGLQLGKGGLPEHLQVTRKEGIPLVLDLSYLFNRTISRTNHTGIEEEETVAVLAIAGNCSPEKKERGDRRRDLAVAARNSRRRFEAAPDESWQKGVRTETALVGFLPGCFTKQRTKGR